MQSVHGNGGTEEAAMTGSLFSLPETQYINVEHIHLVEERERQLPKNRRPRMQQGFAASLFLPLSFSWKFLAPNYLRGGQTHFIGGRGLSPSHWATGTPVAQWPGDRKS